MHLSRSTGQVDVAVDKMLKNRNIGNIPSVQYLRGIAALMVVLFHASREIRSQIGVTTLAWGEFGVDIFFCISGFVMMHSVAASGKPPTFTGFMKNRFIRIAPLYWLMTALMACAIYIKPEIFKSAVLNFEHLALSLLFIPHFHPGIEMAVMPILVPGWTLSYEMYFYILFGLSLALPERLRIAAVTLMLVCGHAAANSGAFGKSAGTEFFANSMVYEFLLGMVISVLYKYSLTLPVSLAAVGAPAAFVLVVACSQLGNRLATAGIFSALLLYAAISIPVRVNKGPQSWLAMLGDSSYSLYLSHIFSIGIVGLLWRRLSLVRADDALLPAMLYLCICVLFSVIVGFILHKLVEVPLTNWTRLQLQ